LKTFAQKQSHLKGSMVEGYFMQKKWVHAMMSLEIWMVMFFEL
jgi:hypothetical protein